MCSVYGEKNFFGFFDLLKFFGNLISWIKIVESFWCLGSVCIVVWRFYLLNILIIVKGNISVIKMVFVDVYNVFGIRCLG